MGEWLKYECQELRGLSNPPRDVINVAGAVLALLGVIGTIDVRNERDPRLWKFFRNNIWKTGGTSLVSGMKSFDPKNVTNDQLEMAKRFMDGLTMEKMSNVSKATCSLYLWVRKAIKATGG